MPHDRDGSVDRLLRGALGPRSTPRVAGPCLDADTAAAWADDTLAGADRSAAEAHAANCARCQALLAAIAKTTPVAPTAPRWRFWSAGWLVPLTGVLAGALVWSVMHSRSVTQTARPHATPVDSLASASSTIASELENLKKNEDRVAQDRVVSSAVKGRAAKVAEPSRPQDLEDRSKDRASLESEAAALQSANAGAARSDRDAVSPSPPAETVGVTGRLEAAKVANAAKLTAPAATAARAADSSAEKAESVSVPARPLNWRIGPGGNVQRSADGGSTWQTEQPGVPGARVPFAALSSPSLTVCWLVGARGTVFLTVDGRTWQRIEFPEPVDLAAVRAIDETTSTVTASDGRSFTTSDRGATWSQVQAR